MNTTPPTAALVQTMRNIRSKDPFMTPAALAAHPDILSWCSRIEENMVVQLNKISVKNLRIYVILVSLYQVVSGMINDDALNQAYQVYSCNAPRKIDKTSYMCFWCAIRA